MTARNDLLINLHDWLQLQGWHANVNLKPILSMNTALQYISKYASKSESHFESFTDMLNNIINNSDSNDLSLGLF